MSLSMCKAFVCALALTLLVHAQNVTVLTRNSTIHYVGTWVDQDTGGHQFTTTPGSSFSFTFPGTAIYWDATSNPLAAKGDVSIDGTFVTQVDASIGANYSADARPTPATLFSQTGLSAAENHTINVTWAGVGFGGRTYLEVYNLTYTQDDIIPTTTPTPTSISSATAPAASTTVTSKKSSSSAGPIASGVVGGIAVLAAAALLF